MNSDRIAASNGITNPDFVKLTQDYWQKRFFSNQSCAMDPLTPGALAFITHAYALGAKIYYVTGRDKDRMKSGTEFSLKFKHLPFDQDRAFLIMREHTTDNELDFKEKAFEWINSQTLGLVTSGFENEPANLNKMHEHFSKAAMIFLEPIHSDRPEAPVNSAFLIPNFKM